MVYRSTCLFFQWWPAGFSLTVCIVLGFYFQELAHLTSSGNSGTLTKMKLPAIAAIALVWIVILVAGGLDAKPVEAGSRFSNSPHGFAVFSFLVIGCAIGVGIVFGALVIGVARQPEERDNLFKLAMLGFALAEALGLLGLMVSLLILFK